MRFNKLYLALALLILFVAVFIGYLSWREFSDASVVVEWTTASELDMAGFNLYRSTLPGGPFTQVNDRLIPPSSDPLTGGTYSYSDEPVEAGKVYFYQLEAVETSGMVERFGPIEVQASSGGKIGFAVAIVLAAISVAITIISKSKANGVIGGSP